MRRAVQTSSLILRSSSERRHPEQPRVEPPDCKNINREPQHDGNRVIPSAGRRVWLRACRTVLQGNAIGHRPDEKAAEKLAAESLRSLEEAIKSAEAEASRNSDWARRVTSAQAELKKLLGTTEKGMLNRFGGKVDAGEAQKTCMKKIVDQQTLPIP